MFTNGNQGLTLAQKLTQLYALETYHKERVTEEEADAYHQSLLDQGRIITVSDKDELIGYVEYCMACGVCYVSNLFIREGYRNSKVIWMLKKRLFEVCGRAKVFIGNRHKTNNEYLEAQLRSKHGK